MNGKRKVAFIKYQSERFILADGEYERFFCTIAPYEKRWDRDACDWSSRRILTWLKIQNKQTLPIIQHLVSLFDNYITWCLIEGLSNTNQNPVEELTLDELKACVNYNKLKGNLITREELIQGIKELKNPRDQFLLLAIFEFGGIKHQFADLMGVSLKDFNPTENELYLSASNRVVVVSDLLYKFAQEAYETEEYYINADRICILQPREDKVIKFVVRPSKNTGVISQKQILFQMRALMKRLTDMLGKPDMTASMIQLSGQVHKIEEYAEYYHYTPEQVVMNKNLYEKVRLQYGSTVNYTQWWVRHAPLFQEE